MKEYKRTYEIFSGSDLVTAERILQLRHIMLVQSYLYYNKGRPTMSDYDWSMLARELADLQNKYPEISEQVLYYEDFKEWDGSTGFHLKYMKPNIVATAEFYYANKDPKVKKTETKKSDFGQFNLF